MISKSPFAVIVAFLCATSAAGEESVGLVGSWSFDEGEGVVAGDSSGNENHGKIINAQWREGKVGCGLWFNGKDAWIDCGSAKSLNLTTGLTIAAWVRPENTRHASMTIVSKGYRYRGNYNLRMGTPWDHSKVMFEAGPWRTHEVPIPFEKWSRVVGVCDGQRVGVFVNGKLVSERPFVSILKANETSLAIGRCIGAPDGGEYFKGVIDEVKVYDRVLPKYKLHGTAGETINRKVRTITSRGEWGTYEGFPGVCRLKNGDLLVVFYAGRDHMGWPHPDLPKHGRICLMRSTDNAKTWSKPNTLIDGPTGERDPSISQMSDGTVVCSYYGTIWYERGRVCEVRTLRSLDNGETWEAKPAVVPAPWYSEKEKQDVIARAGPPAKTASNERPIREEFKAINATTRPVRELSDGTWVLPIYGQFDDQPYRSALARSTDRGATWGDISMISEDHHHCEPDVIELPDGRLFCMLRPCMCQMVSSDRGRTWTEPVRLLRGEAPSLLLTTDNVLVCGHRERPGVRTGAILSTDFGKTWSPPRMIDFAGGAYPSFVELDDGRVLCIHYQEGAGGNIRQTVFKIDRNSRTIELVDP
ncbi:MAG: exo-alpha-sialidase [Pirellulaceae bacterium]|nr:exo-alpha-sialidase [Pirellulaceae bacterium]MDP7014422.1 exo-alpha-sialidase [Pirellulaceae bacterium]